MGDLFYWRLTEPVALRSWRLVPYAYYRRGDSFAKKLTKQQYDLLSRCDGTTQMAPSPQLIEFEQCGLLRRSEIPDPIASWQAPRNCDNRYFPMLNWAVTGRCNYNCRHCFMAADNAPQMAQFSWEECLALLDGCERCGVQSITLTGGEPMLHPQFIELCREIARRGMDLAEITTNGSLITRDGLEELRRIGLCPLMKISFDGLGHHDWMRGVSDAQEHTLAAIRLAHEMGFPVRVQMNVHRLNRDSLLPTADLLDRLGVEELRVIRTTEAPRWTENAGDACLGLEEYYELGLSFTRDYLSKTRQMSVDIWQFLQFWPQQQRYHLRPVELGSQPYRDSFPVCRGNRGQIAITPEGDVVPCNQISGYYHKHGIQLGNVKTADLQPLLQEGAYLDAVTTTVGELFAQNPTCGKCEWRRLCLGGCRSIALIFTGDPMGVDPAKCVYFQKGYVEKSQAVFTALGNWNCTDNLNPSQECPRGQASNA